MNRNKFLGRNIEGISVECRKDIIDTKVQEVISKSGSLILKMKNAKWKETDELFFIVCYTEDPEFKSKAENYFENLNSI